MALNPRGIREAVLLAALRERAHVLRATMLEAARRRVPRRRPTPKVDFRLYARLESV